jgi:hypothetical protein
MAPWTFDIKFPHGTEFTFGSLTFAAGEDGDLRMLPPGEAVEHIALSSASSETQVESDLFDGPYIRTVKLIRGIPVMTSILWPCIRAASSSPSALSSDQGSSKNYPEIGSTPAKAPRAPAASSVWWPRTKISPATAPAGIPPSGGLRRQTPELLVQD